MSLPGGMPGGDFSVPNYNESEIRKELTSVLDGLPPITTFLGLDLKTGALIIAAMGVVHPIMFGCTLFIPMSYMLVTVWILLAIYFASNILLFAGAVLNNPLLCYFWTWYAVVITCLMLLLLLEQLAAVLLLDVNNPLLCYFWTWYAVLFTCMMLVLMMLMACVFCMNHKKSYGVASLFGILWYILTIYFILVVNTHRKNLMDASFKMITDQLDKANEMKEKFAKIKQPQDMREGEGDEEPDTYKDETRRRIHAPILREDPGPGGQTGDPEMMTKIPITRIPKTRIPMSRIPKTRIPISLQSEEDESSSVSSSISRTAMRMLVSVPMRPTPTVVPGHKFCSHNHTHEDSDFVQKAKVKMKPHNSSSDMIMKGVETPTDEKQQNTTHEALGDGKAQTETDEVSGNGIKPDEASDNGTKTDEVIAADKVQNKTDDILVADKVQNKTDETLAAENLQTKIDELSGEGDDYLDLL